MQGAYDPDLHNPICHIDERESCVIQHLILRVAGFRLRPINANCQRTDLYKWDNYHHRGNRFPVKVISTKGVVSTTTARLDLCISCLSESIK